MEDNDGFIPLKKNENGVFTPVENDGFIPVTKTSDGIFVSAEEKKKFSSEPIGYATRFTNSLRAAYAAFKREWARGQGHTQ